MTTARETKTTDKDYPETRAAQFLRYQMDKQKDGYEVTTETPTEPTKPANEVDDSKAEVEADDTLEDDSDTEELDEEEGSEDEADEDTASLDDEDEEDAAPKDAKSDDEPPIELTKEDLSAIYSAYKDDILASEDAQAHFQKLVQSEVDARMQERERRLDDQAKVQKVLQEGITARDRIASRLRTVANELGKASREEDFNPDVYNEQEQVQDVQTFTRALVLDQQLRWGSALDRSILGELRSLPELTPDQSSDLRRIIQVAQRMEGDPQQADDAPHYITSNLIKFLLDKHREAVLAEERTRRQAKGQAAKKVAVANAKKAAAAELAAKRKGTAPSTGKNTKKTTVPGANIEEYQRAKRDGRFADADRIAYEMSLQEGRRR